MKVYIAGKLSGGKEGRTPSEIVIEYVKNIHDMGAIAAILRRNGISPFVPGADIIMGMINGHWSLDDYRETSQEFMEVCDAVLVISHSDGVQKEIEAAQKLCIPVYFDLQQLLGDHQNG